MITNLVNTLTNHVALLLISLIPFFAIAVWVSRREKIPPLVRLWLLRLTSLKAATVLFVGASWGFTMHLPNAVAATPGSQSLFELSVRALILSTVFFFAVVKMVTLFQDAAKSQKLVTHANDVTLDNAQAQIVLNKISFWRPQVLKSAELPCSAVVGPLNPRILLPKQKPFAALELAHEVGHVRHLDHLVFPVQTLVQALLWFVPFSRQILLETQHLQEVCADHWAMKSTESNPADMARLLLDRGSYQSNPVALTIKPASTNFHRRVKSLSGQNHKALWTLLAALAVLGVASVSFSNSEPTVDSGTVRGSITNPPGAGTPIRIRQ